MQNIKTQLMDWQQSTKSDLPRLAVDRIAKLEAVLQSFKAILEDTVSDLDNQQLEETDNIAVPMFHLRRATSLLDD
jgi:hypothetical protein